MKKLLRCFLFQTLFLLDIISWMDSFFIHSFSVENKNSSRPWLEPINFPSSYNYCEAPIMPTSDYNVNNLYASMDIYNSYYF